MKRVFIAFIVIAFLLTGVVRAEERLLIFAGAASKPPTEEVAKLFREKYGVKVETVFGGSGYVLSQMILGKMGDLYFPGSSDFMEIAKRKGVVFPETEKYVVYLVNAINVQKGNPKNIKTLKDLTKPGLKVAIANPEGVCVGTYAVEIIEKNFTEEEKQQFRKNLINYTGSCEKTATAISLKAADAVIGWRVFEYWDPERIETIPLKQEELSRIGYIPIAISKFTKNMGLAQKFIDFLDTEEAKSVYRKYKYFMTPEEAKSWIGVEKPIGGEYKVPEIWLKK
ncbi:molybdate ABC transporter substrate-binding protein [Deferribacterales bacterium Es71-Z0220]|uniref:molybdate ABC transporter substrate-binding protein n=1 Tax=Deferrivibrio essentukiensis TaxID=2880922 RepID=UPI001F610BF0|nr:molybdate ABC transporter substrate-binding protein [Deferrivibrio essentukiensis]MCB4204773.1 molybdate ABC transporter substrate-binding protein [Deferrivibrio essentukiensis]